MENDMMNQKQSPGGGIAGLGNGRLTSSEIQTNTIKNEIENTQSTINEARELVASIESIANEICGPEDSPVNKEQSTDPFSLLSYLESHTQQLRGVNSRLGSLSRRLRETLG
jgi:hypothetical protein